LPGSSLKGVIRSQAERIARTLKSPSACEPFWNDIIREGFSTHPERAETLWCGKRFDMREKRGEKIDTFTAYHHSCPACRLFGSTYFVGRFGVSDAYLMEGSSKYLQQRDGVGIDRFTGGASKGAKFDLEVLAGATFRCNIKIRNFELWQLGWLAYVIQDLKDAMISVGSGTTRGLGRVRGKIESLILSYIISDPKQLEDADGRARVRGVGSLSQEPAYGFWRNDECLLPEGFKFLRPGGQLRYGCRFENGQDANLWFACTERWDDYIKNYTVPREMNHRDYVAELSQGGRR
jgi:CRISPR-associated RAMP protein (TIGR02581 family)